MVKSQTIDGAQTHDNRAEVAAWLRHLATEVEKSDPQYLCCECDAEIGWQEIQALFGRTRVPDGSYSHTIKLQYTIPWITDIP